MNSTKVMQDTFFKYINELDTIKKENIIVCLIEKYPNEKVLINRLKQDIDNLENNSKLAFINNVFDISKDVINMFLLEHIESSISNKTEMIPVLRNKMLHITSYQNLTKEESDINVEIQGNNVINNQKKLFLSKNSDKTIYANYIVSSLFLNQDEELYYAVDDKDSYILSSYEIENTSEQHINKEDSLVKNIQYFIDVLCDKVHDKNKLIKTILIDFITSQNYRNIENLVAIPSDLSQSKYYVINNQAINKSILLDYLYINYYDEIKDIINIISNNYEEIDETILELINKLGDEYTSYLYNLRDNIEKIYKREYAEKAIKNIVEEDYKSITIDDEDFKEKLNNLKKSFGIETKILKRNESGYVSIFSLVIFVMLCGVAIAYLMVK